MNEANIIPVILSGGSGSRLWPLSREAYPKQLLPLAGARTMIQDTAWRVSNIDNIDPAMVVCNQEHRFAVAEQFRELGLELQATILEPVGRNTAPAVAVAALHATVDGADPILLVLPADHVIRAPQAFCQRVEEGLAYALRGHLITFGIKPDRPETGYGYIKSGSLLGDGIYTVSEFVEKPDRDTAIAYLEAGDYAWNSGMFMFRASRYLEELERLQPQMADSCRKAYAASQRDLDFIRLGETEFSACPADSIDYAVMEKTASAAMLPLDVGWSDVGSWDALWEVHEHDEDGNVNHGDVLVVNVHNSFIQARDRLVAAVGVSDLVIVDTADALLVASKKSAQQVKAIVERLHALQRPERQNHRKVYRPWGSYDSIDSDSRFQVKRITVKPGASLSLQMHYHRAEHWVIVEGTAEVTRDDEIILLRENESVYLPLGCRHRLTNPGKIPLQLIEVQCGSYLGEDDIVRFEDNYGREGKNSGA